MNDPIILKEYESSDPIFLGNTDIDFIQTNLKNIISLEIKSQSKYVIHASQHVGSIKFPESLQEIIINPKVDTANFFKMLYAAKMIPEQILDITLHATPGKTLVDLLANIFITATNKIIGTGLYRNYIVLEEQLSSIRGRPLIVKNIYSGVTAVTKPWCEYDELSFDVIENRTILYCCQILLGIVSDDDLKKSLVTIRNIMLNQGITLTPVAAYDLEKITLQRLNKNYEKILELCKFILYWRWYHDFNDNKIPIPAFFVDMNSLFEKFVYETLKENLNDFTIAFQEKNPNVLENIKDYDDKQKSVRVPPIKPDIILRKNNKKLVIDTKYKKNAKNSGDFYQATIYSLVHNCDTLLLFPEMERELSDGFEIQKIDELRKNKIHVKTIKFNDSEDFIPNITKQILDVVNSIF